MKITITFFILTHKFCRKTLFGCKRLQVTTKLFAGHTLCSLLIQNQNNAKYFKSDTKVSISFFLFFLPHFFLLLGIVVFLLEKLIEKPFRML